MRIYNPSLGRFLSVDPLFKEYPELTPYQFSGNTPIQAIDRDGLEPAFVQDKVGKSFFTQITVPASSTIQKQMPKNAIILNSGTPSESPKLNALEQFAVDFILPIGNDINTLIGAGEGTESTTLDKVAAAGNLILLGIGGEGKGTGKGGMKGGMTRRSPSVGDIDMPTERAARREAFRKNNVRTSEANNFKKKVDPDNKEFNILEAKDIHGNDVQIKQHPEGHEFKDNNTYEEPHYHGKDNKGHITYPKKEK